MRSKKAIKRLLFTAALAALCHTTAPALVIEGCDMRVDTIEAPRHIDPATQYARYRIPERPLDFFVLDIDLRDPQLRLRAVNGCDRAVGRERPTDMAARIEGSVAAVNGDYYITKASESGISRMGLYGDGQCLLNATGKPLLVADTAMNLYIGRVDFNATVKLADTVARLHTVNQLRLEWEPATSDSQLSLFTPAFGPELNEATQGGSLAYISPVGSEGFPPNRQLRFTVDSIVSTRTCAPVGRGVLHGVGTSSELLSTLSAGDTIAAFLGTEMPDYPEVTAISEAVGGSGHIVLHEGIPAEIDNAALHPRTAAGISRDGKRLWLVVVDGRSKLSAGISLSDLGRLLQWLGADEGLNLDGGGSSCMVVEGKQVNRPSDGRERAVGNGLVLYRCNVADE